MWLLGLNTQSCTSPASPPLITVQRPSVSSGANPQRANPFLPVPDPFSNSIPPPQPYLPASTARSTSQPPAHRKSVAFADAAKNTSNTSSTTIDSSQQSGHHRHIDATRGYEAGDDTDSIIDAQRTNRSTGRSQPSANSVNAASAAAASSLDPRNGKKRHHHRRRSAEPSTSSGARSAPVDTSASTSRPPAPAASPAPSDETIDLPERFDKYGRKKPEADEDPSADRLDNILAGKGTTGKLFGNFVDGLFGPEGRKKKGK